MAAQGHTRQEGAAGYFIDMTGFDASGPADCREGAGEGSLEATPCARDHNRWHRMSELVASSAHLMATPSRPGITLSMLTQGEFACVVIAYAAPLLLKSMVRHRPAWSVIVKVAGGNVLRP